jgi:hypothetical protein
VEYEYETRKSVRDRALESILEEVRERLKREQSLSLPFYVDGQSIYTNDLEEDENLFYWQERELSNRLDYPLVARLKANSWPHEGEELQVVVDLYGIDGNFDVEAAKITLREAGLEAEHVDSDQARDVFAARVAETIALRTPDSGGPGATIYELAGGGMDTISSRYDGDDIICAKGWFLSTRTVIGQSSCPLNVPPARYSLGVVSGGRTVFHPELWSLPVGRHIYLALP